MMGIVINHSYPCNFSFVLKSPVSAAEMEKSFLYGFCGKTDLSGQGYGRKGVGHIVDTRHGQREAPDLFTFTDTVEGWMGCFVKDNILRCVLGTTL